MLAGSVLGKQAPVSMITSEMLAGSVLGKQAPVSMITSSAENASSAAEGDGWLHWSTNLRTRRRNPGRENSGCSMSPVSLFLRTFDAMRWRESILRSQMKRALPFEKESTTQYTG